MSEFVRRSRKNETNTHDFELEKLKKPAQSQSLEFLELEVAGNHPEKMPDTVPRLPWQLERLVRAASLDDPLRVDVRGVLDPNRYVMAWGCSYLTGDREEALARLWALYRAWKGVN